MHTSRHHHSASDLRCLRTRPSHYGERSGGYHLVPEGPRFAKWRWNGDLHGNRIHGGRPAKEDVPMLPRNKMVIASLLGEPVASVKRGGEDKGKIRSKSVPGPLPGSIRRRFPPRIRF